MPYFTMRDGERIFAYVFGKGQPCILVNGFMAEAKYWKPLVVPMQNRYQFILVDMRGSGKSGSARLDRKPAFTQFAEDIDDLIDALGLEQAKFLGCSMGAYVGLVKHKVTGLGRISSLLLYEHPVSPVSTQEFPYGIHPRVLECYRELVECQAREKLFDQHVPYKQLPENFRRSYEAAGIVTAIHCWPSPWQKKLVELMIRVTYKVNSGVFANWFGLLRTLDDYVNNDYGIGPEDLKKIKVPVTIMYGRHSELFPNQGMFQLEENIPIVKVVPFEKSGHAFFSTEALKFRKEVERFFAEKPSESNFNSLTNSRQSGFGLSAQGALHERVEILERTGSSHPQRS